MLVSLIIFIWFVSRQGETIDKLEEAYTQSFEKYKSQYKSICLTAKGFSVDNNQHLKGRVIVLDLKDLDISKSRNLADDLIARKPDEVQTIVFGEYQKPRCLGSYTGGGESYSGADLVLYVVDVGSKKIIATHTCSGEYPRNGLNGVKFYGSGDEHGSPASWPNSQELSDFLNGLKDRKYNPKAYLDIRKATVEQSNDPLLLAKIAVEDKDPVVRRAAIGNLTDQYVLAKIAVGDRNDFVRADAVAKLTDQNTLAKIAVKDGEWLVRCHAVRRLTDQGLLAKIAVEDWNEDVRIFAREKIINEKLLVKIDKEEEVYQRNRTVFVVVVVVVALLVLLFIFRDVVNALISVALSRR
ncbi:MAG: HEAT repeat domain-containing protein [Candidatus Omnitrophica bacterium]|nr:HEAT repeat domain-containing protein [Candidatus Omnitrophota bacterium]